MRGFFFSFSGELVLAAALIPQSIGTELVPMGSRIFGGIAAIEVYEGVVNAKPVDAQSAELGEHF